MSQSEEEDVNLVNEDLLISADDANRNYLMSGSIVQEKSDEIDKVRYEYLMTNDKVDTMIKEVLRDVHLPFSLTDTQLLSLHVLGNKNNLILVSPTGSGKMLGKKHNSSLLIYTAPIMFQDHMVKS